MFRNQKLRIEIDQTNLILNNFSNLLQKTQKLRQKIGCSNQQLSKLKKIQRQAKLKINVLDHGRLVNLKNQLVQSVSQLSQIQRLLCCQKQKVIVNNQNQYYPIKRTFKSQLRNNKQNIQVKQYRQNIQDKQGTISKKFGDLQLPIYTIRNQSVEDKLDSISKFIAAIRKNIKVQLSTNDQFKVNEYLNIQPQHLKVRQQLQRYKMRQEQLLTVIHCLLQKQNKYLHLENPSNKQLLKNKPKTKLDSSYHITNQKYLSKNNSLNNSNRKIKEISNQKNQDNNRKLDNKYMNQIIQLQGIKLKELRQRREKIFNDSEIWDHI